MGLIKALNETAPKIIKVKINEQNPQLVNELYQIREKMNEDIIRWAKKFYQLRDSLDYQVLFHMWKENKEEIYKKQMFDLLAKYHLSYGEYKAYIQKKYPKYYEIFYSMNKKIYRRFVDAVLNERSLGYFNEKTRKKQQLLLTPYNKEGGSNLLLKKGYIDFETIHLVLDVVDCILLEEYQNNNPEMDENESVFDHLNKYQL